jgi:hypothetical protein
VYLSTNDYHQLHFRVLDRALARARAIELDFTDGGDEEETVPVCPVCQESNPLLRLYRQASVDPSHPSLRK